MPSVDDRLSKALTPEHAKFLGRAFEPYSAPPEPTPEQKAEAEIAARYAARQMPEDIRRRAREWRMEAFCEVLWSAAFLAGYRDGVQDRPTPEEPAVTGGSHER